MTALDLLGLIAVTSLGAYVVGTRGLHLPPAALRRAGARALDCLGLGVLFLAANLVLGVALVLGLRVLTGRFVSLYQLNDVALGLFSCLQALIFQWWRHDGETSSG